MSVVSSVTSCPFLVEANDTLNACLRHGCEWNPRRLLVNRHDHVVAVFPVHRGGDAVLRGEPYGDERCANCQYYSEVDKKISYCWHMKLRILVGADWWCQWW